MRFLLIMYLASDRSTQVFVGYGCVLRMVTDSSNYLGTLQQMIVPLRSEGLLVLEGNTKYDLCGSEYMGRWSMMII